MLTSLTIHQLAIVDHLELDFRPGMTVITGETGAGKSILLQALGLALGDRADADSLRHGTDRAEVSARFDLTHQPQARAWLQANDLDDQECLLRRSIMANGRSKAWINGQPCPVQQLKALGELLLDMHGQHAHHSLLKKDIHWSLLDAYAGLEAEQAAFAAQWRDHQALQKQIRQLEAQDAAQQARIQLLRYQVEELDQLALVDGELEALEQEQAQLANAEQLIATGEQALAWCDQDEGGALQQVTYALQALKQLPLASLDNVCQLLSDAQIQLQEASRDLAHFTSQLELDPQRLQALEARLNLIYQTARKHQVTPENLLAHHQSLRQTLAREDVDEAQLETLKHDLEAQEQRLTQTAAALSARRREAAARLEEAVDAQLACLGMEKSQFRVSFEPLTRLQPQGAELVEFLIAPNPGQPAKPLVKIASGGELSRISLAIQVVTAHLSQIPTLVFDEVDVGISGATAEIVGRLLHQLATQRQVLCVTHLPQVAAQGDWHLHIHKTSSDKETLSHMALLDEEGRVQELARMLGGVQLSASTLNHAREMLKGWQH